ncbi:hypothetical protein [Actibacterium sp. 188UL27-1]|uniref:hypothetical protein n=1 Tax=Actibacterium sp. 188UL27-1 TaxID=2786961 RepID=UPI00195B6910|nr:hypothetical protein [Actibacterium sp. 188UL27-1]MBM7068259.1 hypothetical protein [Actibacterium sp. 188UL27-1]
MLILAAILLFAVGLMHSLRGDRHLIAPILALPDLPIILGSRRNTELTLRIGWHVTTLFWWILGVVLIVMQFRIAAAPDVLLWGISGACGVTGLAALILSRGKHMSWVFFLPIAVLAGVSALWA